MKVVIWLGSLLVFLSCAPAQSPQTVRPSSPTSPALKIVERGVVEPRVSPLPTPTVEYSSPSAFLSPYPNVTLSPSPLPSKLLSQSFSANGITLAPFAGTYISGHRDGDALDAQFSSSIGRICQDKQGNIYIPERTYLRKLSVDGLISTVAGTQIPGFQDGTSEIAQFNFLTACAVDQNNNIYLTDRQNLRIRKITSKGIVSTFAGSGEPGYGDGEPEKASFQFPDDLVIDERKQCLFVYIAGSSLRKIDLTTGIVSTLNEQRREGDNFTGFNDGPLQGRHLFGDNLRLAIAPQKSVIYILDYENRAIRQIQNQDVSTLAGGSVFQEYFDGQGKSARFRLPSSIAFEPERNLIFVADKIGLRLVFPNGRVSTLALPGQAGTTNTILGGIGSIFVQDKNHLIIESVQNKQQSLVARLYRITLPEGQLLPEILAKD